MWFKLAAANFSAKNLGKMADISNSYSINYNISGFAKTTAPTSVEKGKTISEIKLTLQENYEMTGTATLTYGSTSVNATVSGSTYKWTNITPTGSVTITAKATWVGTGEEPVIPPSGGDTSTETVALVFTEGTLDSVTGAEKTATGTYRSDYVAVDASSVIKFTSAKTMIVFKYDSSKTYTGRDKTDWYSASEVAVSDAAYVRVLVKGASAPPTDGTVTRTSSSGGDGGSSGGSENLGDTTFGASKTPVTIISDFSGFTFENGKVVSTSSGSSCDFSTGTARAASTTQILSVSGGKTYTFTPTISGLQYALIEFTDAPCTVSTLNKSGQYGQAWSSTTSGTIHSNTKYLTINFNRGSGNFSASELEALKNAIKIN